MAESVADILGCPLDYAASLLEAAGGNPEMAIELGLSGGMMGMDDDGGAAAAAADLSTNPFAHWGTIWPEPAPLPDSWKNQRLDSFVDDNNSGIDMKMIQPLNGPCGVLAVVQAELWLQPTAKSSSNSSTEDKEQRLNNAIAKILSRVTAAANTTVVTFPHDGTTLPVAEAAQQIRTASALVEVAATTVGRTTGNPLVEGPHWLCTSDLMCLLLRGKINGGNFGAFDPITKKKSAFYDDDDDKRIGILSMMEINEGIPVSDDLKFDKQVWVLHTGDHFTNMRSRKSDRNEVIMEIYDGLKPIGPCTMYYTLTGDLSLASRAPEEHVDTFKKKRPGQPDDIVQAKKTDSNNFKEWTFEVVPAVDDPDVQGPMDDDPQEPVYKFDSLPAPEGRWRCATCYANRFQTMNFGTNEPGSEECGVCNRPRAVAMWSLWQSYDELSPRMKRRARNMYAPKQELVISTLYPKAEMVEEDATSFSSMQE